MAAGTANVTVRINPAPAVTNTVSAGMAKGLLEFAVQRGADRAALLAASGLEAAAVEHEDRRVLFSQYAALCVAAERLCADPALALHFGEVMEAMDLLLVCHVGSAQATMGEAFAAINRLGRLSVDVRTVDRSDPFQAERSPEGLWVVDASVYPGGITQLTETSFTRLIAGTRQLTSRDFVRAVHFVRGEPAHREEYARIFRAPVLFEQQRNAMLLDPEWFSVPLPAPSQYAGSVLESHAHRLLEDLPPLRYRRRVEDAVRSRLASGGVTMAGVARQLGTSRQTLYRRLKQDGTTFERLVDRVRHDDATHLLRQGVSVTDTAHRLGFSDRSAFSRAYKRWTGRSPRSAP